MNPNRSQWLHAVQEKHLRKALEGEPIRRAPATKQKIEQIKDELALKKLENNRE